MESVAWLAGHLIYVYRGLLVHLILTYPDGRASSRPIRVSGGVGYLASVVTPVWESETATILLSAALVAMCGLSTRGRSVGAGVPASRRCGPRQGWVSCWPEEQSHDSCWRRAR